MKVPAKIDLSDPVVTHGLSCPVKYVRMVRRVIRERERFYAQLVCQGEPYCKDRLVRCGPVGLDIGTQTIAAVSRKQAFIEVFCRELYRDHKKIRRIQRRMDRLRRENNPDNFRSDGTFKKQGNRKVQWKDSREYRRERKRLRELHRKESAHRRNVHGQLVARVLRLGSDVKLEKISYQSWPKKKKRKGNQPRRRYGRSVNFCAPSLFVSRLKQEIAKWGGQVTEFNTQTTKLSQVCHCGYSAKKSLNQRWHQCPQCGIVVQRDLYSAFLASYVENGTLRADQAGNAWSSICTALGTALNQVKDAPGRLPSSLGLRKLKKSALSLKDRKNLPDSADVVRAVLATEGREKGEENDHNTQFFVDALNGTPNLVIDYG